MTGETIPVGLEPYEKGENAFMALISNAEYGVWEIQSLAPKPAMRVFGAFVKRMFFLPSSREDAST